MQQQSISKSILAELKNGVVNGYSNGEHAMMAWGASNFVGQDYADNYGLGWLKFKVHSTAFKGWVRCAVNGQRTINVTFEEFNNKTGEYTTPQRLSNVIHTDLAAAIDRVLEPQPDQE